MKPPTKHNTLNDKQLYILKLAYKFRFITAPLLAKQGYLLRRKDPTPFDTEK